MTDPREGNDPVEKALREVAEAVGGTVHRYPSPRNPVRRRTLREVVSGEDSQFEEAVLDADGTVYVIGRDSGPQVSAVFGEAVSTYEWVYVIAPGHVPDLRQVAGATAEQDVLEVVAQLYQRVSGRLYHPLTDPPVSAVFDCWHS
ncbi:MAG: hypothetical protein IRY85_10700 [Micromonosporaceae bacterium]|nr:hypothetical protein [Micromonosporaceae bacterium]